MDRIEQAIRESLLESYLYRESAGQAVLADPPVLRKRYLRGTSRKTARKRIDNEVLLYRANCSDPVNQLAVDHPFRKICLEDHMTAILLNELQKMRTE